ncbi:hypothetical protein ACRRTK_010189 [Alexandromys fortis]
MEELATMKTDVSRSVSMTSSLIQKPTSKLVMALRLIVLCKMTVYFVAIIGYINLSKEKTGSMVCVACRLRTLERNQTLGKVKMSWLPELEGCENDELLQLMPSRIAILAPYHLQFYQPLYQLYGYTCFNSTTKNTGFSRHSHQGRSSPLFDIEKESTGIDNEKGREEGEKQDGE